MWLNQIRYSGGEGYSCLYVEEAPGPVGSHDLLSPGSELVSDWIGSSQGLHVAGSSNPRDMS